LTKDRDHEHLGHSPSTVLGQEQWSV
jgi:hypothetical protein